jgi:uncharacterized protein YxeA
MFLNQETGTLVAVKHSFSYVCLILMKLTGLKYFVSLIILFHCVGLTQLLSAYNKNAGTFVSMLSQTEEETKKEKESKEDDCSKEYQLEYFAAQEHVQKSIQLIYLNDSKSRITHQFVIELPTPPPDLTA